MIVTNCIYELLVILDLFVIIKNETYKLKVHLIVCEQFKVVESI